MPDSFGGNKISVTLSEILPPVAIEKLLRGEKIAVMFSLQVEKRGVPAAEATPTSKTVVPFGWTWSG